AERGRIGIFNRSYYEEVLVVRVHPEVLRRQRLPGPDVGKKIWDQRLADIAHFEDYLARQGTIILKFFLHVSRAEQKRRFMQRLERPQKHWKFSASEASGPTTCTPSRKQSAPPRRREHPGSSCPRTTSGSPGSWSPPRSWKRSRSST